MTSLHEKRKQRVELAKAMTDEQKAEQPYLCEHEGYAPLSYVNKDEALKVFTDSNFKAEYTKLLNDGTKRWYWTVRDENYTRIGFILGVPTVDQKQGNHSHNDPFKSHFDYMEIKKKENIKGYLEGLKQEKKDT